MNFSLPRSVLFISLILVSINSSFPVDAFVIRGEAPAPNTADPLPITNQQRQVLDNHEQQERRRHHHHRHHQHHSNANRYYMQEQEQQQEYYRRSHQKEPTLGDVWLCYAFALGWSMWFLASFSNTDLMRFAESESAVLVHGNVREVSIEDDSLGTGIPTYHALIDYIITVKREADAARIQVRKSFQTQHLLQQGFANVELLVLPEEPTSSVLKEDWQREVAAQEQVEEDIISVVMPSATLGGRTNGSVGGTTEKEPNRRKTSRVDIWVKRASLVFAGILVTVSLLGAVQAVHRIPNEQTALLGWISVVVGSVLLWPLALFSLRIVSACQRLGRLPTEKSGIILKCDTNAEIETAVNEEQGYTQHHDMKLNRGDVTTRYLDKVEHAGVLEKLKNRIDQSGETTETKRSLAAYSQASANMQEQNRLHASADESACYFVKLPGDKDPSHLACLDSSSLSTISANSHDIVPRSTRNLASRAFAVAMPHEVNRPPL